MEGEGRSIAQEQGIHASIAGFGLYTILCLPILYGVWHKGVGAVGGRILLN